MARADTDHAPRRTPSRRYMATPLAIMVAEA